MNDDLRRQISLALDSAEGLEGDASVRATLARDREARLYADDLLAIDDALHALGRDHAHVERDFEALAASITARLDDFPLDDIGDVTLPPGLDEDVEVSGPVRAGSTGRDVPAALPAMSAAAVPNVSRAAAPVVDLASRRRLRTWFTVVGGLAAAAAVGLGVTAGITLGGDEAEMAAFDPSPPSGAVAEMQMAEEEASADEAAPAEEAAPAATDALGEAAPATPAPAPAMPPPAPADYFATGDAPAETRARAERSALQRPLAQGVTPMPPSRAARMAGPSQGAGAGADEIFNPFASPAPAREAASPADRRASAEPTRRDTQESLHTALATVRACLGRTDAVARVEVTVRGADGRITDVTVHPPFAEGVVRECIADAVRQVRMPTSEQPTYRASHVFQPAPIAGGSPTALPPAVRARRAAPASNDVLDPFHRQAQ